MSDYGIFEYDLTMRAMTKLKYIQCKHNPTDEQIRIKVLKGEVQGLLKKLEKYHRVIGNLENLQVKGY